MIAKENNLKIEYSTLRQLQFTKASSVFQVQNNNTKKEYVRRDILCYDKKSNPRAEKQEDVFKIHKTIQKLNSVHLPYIKNLSAFMAPVQVIQEDLSAWRSLKHYQSKVENGALPERFVSAAIFEIIKALSLVHKEGIAHCNIDLDNVMVILAPFGGDTFKLCNWDNARCNFSRAQHPIFQNEAERKRPFVAPEIAETATDAKKKPTLSTAVDIWSLGVLTFILRTACLPLNRDNQT